VLRGGIRHTFFQTGKDQPLTDQALIEAEMKWTDSINRNRGLRQADIEELQGKQAGLNASLFGIQIKAERSAAKLKVAQARLEGFGAQGQAAGQRRAGVQLRSDGHGRLHPLPKPHPADIRDT
jgi:hypothetical protein